MNWDGRHFSIGGLIQSVYFKLFSPVFSIWFGICSFFISLLILIKSFKYDFKLANLLIVFTLLLIGLLPFYKDIIFWQTGVVYSVFLLQTCLSLYIYLKKNWDVSFVFMFILILSINSQNLNITFGAYVFLNLIFKFEDTSVKKDLLTLLAILLGTLFVSLAPGNNQRMIFMDSLILEKSSYGSLILSILYKSLTYSKYSLILGFFSGFLFSKNHSSIWNFILIISIGFASIIPFLFVPQAFSIRVVFIVAFFCFIAGLEFTAWVKNRFNFNSYYFFYLIVLSLIFGNIIFYKQFLMYKELSAKIQSREIYLQNLPNQSVGRYPYIPLPDGLFITRSPSYEDLWKSEFLEYYRIKEFIQF
jgi:hypothetical protein